MKPWPVPQTKLNSGEVRLRNSAKILALGPHLCTRIWVRTMIGLLKKAIVNLPIRMKGNLKRTSGDFIESIGGLEQGCRHCFADVTNRVNRSKITYETQAGNKATHLCIDIFLR